MCAADLRQTLRCQSPTLLRWGNSPRQFFRIDSYVRERLALFDSKKRQKYGDSGHESGNSSPTIGGITGRGSTGRMGAAAGGARSRVVIALAPVEPAAYAV